MQLTIKNIQAIQALDLTLEAGPNVLAGSNEAGKSTTCHIVAALMARDMKLAPTKAEVAAMIRTGARSGMAAIGDDQGRVGASWPDGELLVEGDNPPMASAIATGRTMPARLSPKERTALLVEALKALPTQAEWIAAAEAASIPKKAAEAAWRQIDSIGWDNAAKAFADRAKEGKGAWRQLTNVSSYPPKGAESWQAGNHDLELVDQDLDAVSAEVDALVRQRDDMLRDSGVLQARRVDLVAKVGALSALRERREQLTREIEAAEPKLAAARQAHERKVMGHPEAQCPHCSQRIAIHPTAPLARKVEAGITVDPKSFADSKTALERLEAAFKDLVRQQSAVDAQIKTADEAASELEKLPPAHPLDTAKIDAEIEAKRTLREDIRITKEARRLHLEIVALTAAAGLAAATGLRKTKLGDLVDMMNSGFADLCEATGWGKVEVDLDLHFSLGGIPWERLSSGARWRVDAAIALFFAERDSSDLVVLDAADLLDKRGRNGLLRLTQQFDIPVLIGMTLNRSEAQQLADANIPVTFLEAGIGRPVTAAAMAAE
ncbi:MAG: hypothetical protein RJA36_1485 [Pseudomonadota bacterium]|jgi:DNA-directed RNA polymerase subunit RPC12/RpoP